jgi:hypothetical protein
MLSGIDRSWSRDAPTQPPSSPALLYSLAHLEEQLKAAYKLVTEGKFSEALRVFVRMLQVRCETGCGMLQLSGATVGVYVLAYVLQRRSASALQCMCKCRHRVPVCLYAWP